MDLLIKKLTTISPAQILALRPGAHDDYSLVEALAHFDTERGALNRRRWAALSELILRSPLHHPDLAYEEIYFALIDYYRVEARDFAAALRWAHAAIAYNEQHPRESAHMGLQRDLAETYLRAGDVDTGLALFARCLRMEPDEIDTYNILGLTLPDAGLPGLAVEVLDRALAIAAPDDELRGQLAELRAKAAALAAQAAGHEAAPRALADVRAALQDAPIEPGDAETAEPYLPPIDRLVALGPEPDAALDAEIAAQAKVLIPDLIRVAFDPALRAGPAPAHAVRLLRALADAGAAELGELAFWLGRADGEWWDDLLTERCGKIGGFTTDEIEAIAGNAGNAESVRSMALEALTERAARRPEQRERVVAYFRNLLAHPEADTAEAETYTAWAVSAALDAEFRELYDEIERAFAGDRVDASVLGLNFVREKWGMAPLPVPPRRDDGMYLLLRCTACGRERDHFVQHVLVDVGTQEREQRGEKGPYSAYVMDREIVCPKCGAVDRYTPAGTTILKLSGLDNLPALMQLTAGRKPTPADVKPNPRVHHVRMAALGRPMHPLVALEEYRRRLARRPKEAQLHLGLGNLLRTIGRWPEAIEHHRQAHTLNPRDPLITYNCALSEHDFGDKAVARQRYEEVLALDRAASRGRGINPLLVEGAHEGLRRLERGKPSPYVAPYDADLTVAAAGPAPAERPTARVRRKFRR